MHNSKLTSHTHNQISSFTFFLPYSPPTFLKTVKQLSEAIYLVGF